MWLFALFCLLGLLCCAFCLGLIIFSCLWLFCLVVCLGLLVCLCFEGSVLFCFSVVVVCDLLVVLVYLVLALCL